MRTLCILTMLLPAAGGTLKPYGLECEARHNPTGIDVPAPRLSWRLASSASNQRQTAYRIIVSQARDGSAVVWDSGRVASADTAWIPYAGKPLDPFARLYWKVQTWDASGSAGEFSDAAEFTTTRAPSGSWISSPDRALTSGPLPLFRTTFRVEKPVRRALAVVAGVGFHELYINGAKVGDHVLAPAWSNYRSTVYYETFDITAQLRPGDNAAGVMLGNGFYNVAGGRYTKYTGSFGHPRLNAQIHLEFQDGLTRDIRTGSDWKTQAGPVTFACIYGGEDFDATRELRGWSEPGFDDSAWSRPAGNEAPGGVLRSQASPPIRVQQSMSAVRVTQPKPGIKVYDFGQNFSGWPKLTARGPAGATIKMVPGELLDDAGLVSQRSSGGPVWFSYKLKGAGSESWTPRFSYYGFRYVQIDDVPGVELSLAAEFIHLDAKRVGEFACSNPLFNQIHALISAAVRSNLQHVLTDCPHREKLGWLEQAHLMGPSLLYNWDLRTFLPKIVRDMREAQTVDGLVPDIAPEYVVFGGGFRDSPEWGSSAVLVPRMAWDWYGDRATLASAYPMMTAYLRYLDGKLENGVLNHGLGDWYDIGPKPPGSSQLTPRGLTATAVYLEDARVAAETAAWLKLPADAARFNARRSEVLKQFRARFGTSSSQTAFAMPLALGLGVPASAERLVDDIRAHGNHTTAGDVGYRYVVDALIDANRNDVLFDLANQRVAPSYAGQLAAGATALAEAWDANPASSQNHLMLGHIERWFWAGLAGIRPEPQSPGLTRIRIEPAPVGDVKWAKASWETPRGTVAVDWSIESGAFHMKLDVPPGVQADVRLPGKPPVAVGSGHHEY